MTGKAFRLFVLLVICIGFFYDANAQNIDFVDETRSFSEQLLPLDTLIELAVKNSPTVSHYDALVDKFDYQIDIARRLWQNNIYGFANYSTGDQRIITGGTGMPGDITTSSIASGYRAGLQVNIPLFEFTSRRKRINFHEAERDAAIYKKDEQQLDVVRQVIEEYYIVIGAFETMKTRGEGKEAMRMYYLVAEREFSEGIIPISELSQVKNSLSQSEVYYQDARHLFFGKLASFAALVGVRVSGLMKQQ